MTRRELSKMAVRAHPGNPKGSYTPNRKVKVRPETVALLRRLGMQKAIGQANAPNANDEFIEAARRFYGNRVAPNEAPLSELPVEQARLGQEVRPSPGAPGLDQFLSNKFNPQVGPGGFDISALLTGVPGDQPTTTPPWQPTSLPGMPADREFGPMKGLGALGPDPHKQALVEALRRRINPGTMSGTTMSRGY